MPDGIQLAFIGTQELIIILVIVIVLFGARRIPDLARGLGEGIRNFRTGMREEEKDSGGDKNSLSGGGEG